MSTVSPDKDKLCNFSALDMLQNIFHTYQLGMEYFSALDKSQNIFHKIFFYEWVTHVLSGHGIWNIEFGKLCNFSALEYQ